MPQMPHFLCLWKRIKQCHEDGSSIDWLSQWLIDWLINKWSGNWNTDWLTGWMMEWSIDSLADLKIDGTFSYLDSVNTSLDEYSFG